MISPTIVSKIKSLMLAFAILPVMVFAQTTISADKLTEVSDEMYKHGNENYILVDAIKDGIIELNERYNFTYTNGHIRFNGEDVPSDLRKTYENKLERLLVTSGKGLDTRMYYRGGGIKKKDILNETSSFRKKVDYMKQHEDAMKQHDIAMKQHVEAMQQHEVAMKRHDEIIKEHDAIAKKQTAYTNRIINSMYNDKLIADKDDVKIKWNSRGVFVNGKKLKGEIADKYESMFEKETGIKPTGWDDGVSITRTP